MARKPQRQRSKPSLESSLEDLMYAFEMEEPLSVLKSIVIKNPKVLEHRHRDGMNFLHEVFEILENDFELEDTAELFDLIKFLVRRGKKALRMKDSEGNLPLHIVCQYDSPSCELIGLLVNNFPDSVRVRNQNDQTPLHVAISCRLAFDAIKFLLDLYPEAVLETDKKGRTPLHTECSHHKFNDEFTDEDNFARKREVMELLLSRNSELMHVPDDDGWTPIYILCQNEGENTSREIIRIVHDACPEAATKVLAVEAMYKPIDYLNAFDLACRYRNLPAVQFLLDINPCLFIMLHDDSQLSWKDFYLSLKESFKQINNLKDDIPHIYECVRNAAVSLVRKITDLKRKPLSDMQEEVAEHLAGLLQTRPFPTLQELNPSERIADALPEDEIFKNLQDMLCDKRFQKFLKAYDPMLIESRRDPENKAKAVVALTSVSSNADLLFHQLHRNPLIIESSFKGKQRKRKHVDTKKTLKTKKNSRQRSKK